MPIYKAPGAGFDPVAIKKWLLWLKRPENMVVVCHISSVIVNVLILLVILSL
jgi:hypothetical protein